ncbi:MAG: hypothetical protein RL582_1648 [Bacteroidota bacterium]|jgi:hypothetical protein
MSFTSTASVGNKHQEITKRLDFYEQEINFLQKMLTEVIQKNTGVDVTAEAEHYQNQFTIQLKNLNDYRNQMKDNKHLIFRDAKEHAGKVDNRVSHEAMDIEKKVLQFEKIVDGLKKSFKTFASKWL